jgi:hypothetical protein
MDDFVGRSWFRVRVVRASPWVVTKKKAPEDMGRVCAVLLGTANFLENAFSLATTWTACRTELCTRLCLVSYSLFVDGIIAL